MAVEPQGLTTAHASAVLTTDGPNVIPQPRRRSLPRRFLDQFIHFFALLLWGAAVLAAIARLPQVSIAIVSVIIVNALFAFIQESRADRAADRLTALLPTLVTVIRDGRRTTVDASHVVRGDLICLESGDRVPADARVVRANILRLDASMMTGESVPVDVGVGEIVFAGTFVVEGEADALVEKTGSSTRIADIAQMSTAASSRVTPLALELRRVVRLIAVIAISVGALFFVITLLLGNAPAQGLIFGIGVTVALVPEALLPTVTLTLAWGAEHMANRHVLVRDLEAVETLGSTTIICTDKTGTLTRNEMTVLSAWTPQGSATATEPGYQPEALVTYGSTSDHAAIRELARVAQACSDGYVYEHEDKWLAHGDPMEAALDAFAQRVDPALVMSDVVATLKFPFDPRRRRMSVVRDGHVLVKGAPDSVLPLCSEVGDAQDAAALLAANGLRVLAVATRSLVDGDLPRSPNAAETDLTLVGLIGLEDPPRSDVRTSI
ncbi:MAG: HAD-IC family P-type ATPase, partial [Candidatus Nanopelagicales bacterium]